MGANNVFGRGRPCEFNAFACWRILRPGLVAVTALVLASSTIASASEPTSAEIAALTAPSPSADVASTDEAGVRLLRPTSLADRMTIEGDVDFSAIMREALASIDLAQDDTWRALVSDNLCGIRLGLPNELPAGAFGGMLATPEGGVALFDSTKADVAYIASVIVHEAWHHKQFAAKRTYYGPAAENEAMEIQADFLAQIAQGHPGIPYLHGLIAQLPGQIAR
jgi:hypothetical protein